MNPIRKERHVPIARTGITLIPLMERIITVRIGIRFINGIFADCVTVHCTGIQHKMMKVIIAGARNMQILSLNFILIVVPVTAAAATEVSEMKDRLSPAMTPLTTTPQARGALTSECATILSATGINAVAAPMEDPIEKLRTSPIINMPGSKRYPGRYLMLLSAIKSDPCIAEMEAEKAPDNR